PTAVTLDVDLTDGTDTLSPIAAGALGNAAGQVLLEPSAAIKFAGSDKAPQLANPIWRVEVDFNFTGGSSPTVTGWLVLRFAH
ncbi:MAG: hypothetical protein KC445_21980, partial [Anaerolineales bacterium]|nr:hypothetical protein [Anaerolineales bacterium]